MAEEQRSSTPCVLIAEDDRAVRESLERALRLAGYHVLEARDGREALERIAAEEPDVAVVDVMMPHVDGFTVCQRLRDAGDRTPVLLLTARDAVEDRVRGLDSGADDYLPKPFALEELLARLRVMLRRTEEEAADGAVLEVGDLVLDPGAHRATRGGELVELTRTEFALLELLMANAGIVLSRETIYERIWGWDFETSSKTLDVYIGYLRRKTEVDDRPRLIHTVRGIGYTLRAA